MKTDIQQTQAIEILPFSDLKQAVQRRFNDLKGLSLYRSAISPDDLWSLYLESFPEGTNPKYRERTQHDCSHCRSFIKNVGNLVAIQDGEIVTLWDIQVGGQYQPVVDAMAKALKKSPIGNIFIHNSKFQTGLDKNFEETANGVVTWGHFYVSLPRELVKDVTAIGPLLSESRSKYDVMIRSLNEISKDSVEIVKDLIMQDSLYRGAEKAKLIDAFLLLKTAFDQLKTDSAKAIFAWKQVHEMPWVCKIRNDVIGTLLVDLSSGVNLETAVKTFEDKVSGTNYKRTTALITPKMKEQAKQALIDLGLLESLERRYAKLEDIKVTNVLFADRDAKARMSGDVFDLIPTNKSTTPQNFDKVEEITIAKFIENVLPTAKSIEVLVENKHASNFVSLIAPHDLTAKSLFKWNNAFSWSYTGDVADSIKEKVKKAGGNVTGELCCRLSWYNHDDLDFHLKKKGIRTEIYYGSKLNFSGCLDVDMNAGGRMSDEPVENIYFDSIQRMPIGEYLLFVHQFCKRSNQNVGFEVEIDHLGSCSNMKFERPVQGSVEVATIVVTEQHSQKKVSIIPHLNSTSHEVKKNIWSISTQEFHSVSALMLSPNFWDGEGIGNKHYFFMLNNCKNDGSARGFYNEFLKNELEPHRKTMEMVGAHMRTEESEDQMSGLGFSSTQRAELIVKVTGPFQRILKVKI